MATEAPVTLPKAQIPVNSGTPTGKDSSAAGNGSIASDFLSRCRVEFLSSKTGPLARNAVTKCGMKEIMLDHTRSLEMHQHFSNRLNVEGAATSQCQTGRCWLFAACNELRLPMIEEMKLPVGFELSQAFLFFWDKLEKANYFLHSIVTTSHMPEDCRLVQYLLQAPVNDGGQYMMFANIVAKYGLCPKDVYPETFHSKSSRPMKALITSKLREYASTLRTAVAPLHKDGSPTAKVLLKHTEEMRQKMVSVIYNILAVCMGIPPSSFVWRFTDTKKEFVKMPRMTTQQFAKDVIKTNLAERVSLINDPRNEYFQCYTVEKLGNMVEGEPVLYVNVPMDVMRQLSRATIDDGRAVWFGCDVGKFYNRDAGVLDVQQFNYPSVFGTTPFQKDNKARRLRFCESKMTHAMLFTGYDLNDDGSVRGWRVENSHGPKRGNKGYMIMTDQWFNEFLYQIVVDESRLAKIAPRVSACLEAIRTGKAKPILLPAWDPMGALA